MLGETLLACKPSNQLAKKRRRKRKREVALAGGVIGFGVGVRVSTLAEASVSKLK